MQMASCIQCQAQLLRGHRCLTERVSILNNVLEHKTETVWWTPWYASGSRTADCGSLYIQTVPYIQNTVEHHAKILALLLLKSLLLWDLISYSM